jgi:hypothetical protein
MCRHWSCTIASSSGDDEADGVTAAAVVVVAAAATVAACDALVGPVDVWNEGWGTKWAAAGR